MYTIRMTKTFRRDTADWSAWGSYTRKPKYCTPDGKCY